ncbi:dihydrodipicolinate reductase C-terminal domain-containing protein [Rhodohalobacter sp.]|uniref:dihydrodipicolinate reductase C-terminal domain-containing protein n=1 Tax=Rhodohalobacter sp. TaxID=1974210 RepID=UPI002ACE0A1E|nr:dihydrodipicolinate reductase C-terminal domain-containing protein [Rhodohalobacter sp.]MDZ7755326.1 dihydrodipicolinate reductase C-terminal domain-containing protein [Rhodohalobacter sp.]
MKVSVIGTGKTGSEVAELLGKQAVCFDSKSNITADKLKETDIAIIFVPGEAAEEVSKVVLESGIPAVWGTTGYSWPEKLPDQVKEANARWVIGANFSLGMNLIRKALNILGKGGEFLKDPEYHIHEVHHVHKKDAPSGTALSWKKWLGRNASISSDRQGDVKGVHNLHLQTDNESIYLKHEAHSRKLFAEGAIWTAEYLLENSQIEPGVYPFSSIFDQAFSKL